MVEVPEVALPRSGSGPLALSEARRARNRSRITPVSEIRCECTQPSCRDRVPAVAETHREADEFVVTPAHSDGVAAVRVADQFFVVELRTHTVPRSLGEAS